MSSIRKFGVVSGVVVSAAIIGACDLGADDGAAPGGVVMVSAVKSGTTVYGSASAFFIARLDTSNGAALSSYDQSLIPDIAGDCEILDPEATPKETPMVIGLDVGSEVVLDNGTAAEEIVLTASFSEGYYSTSTVVPGEGKSYSITLEGTTEVPQTTWSNALALPELFELNNFQTGEIAIDSDTGKDVAWDSVGADAVVFTFQGEMASGRCVTADDGTFKIPGEFADDLGTSGYFSVMAISQSTQVLNGREVLLAGSTGESGYFTVSGTPNPTPTPTPSGNRLCDIVWMTSAGTNLLHAYIVELPEAQFTSGTKNYDGSTVIGALLYNYNTTNGSAADQAVAPSGSFSLTATGTALDDDVSFTDNTSQTYQSQVSATVSGGTGSYVGKISPDNAPTNGTGTIAITYNGTALSIGAAGSYSICFEPAAFAGTTAAQRFEMFRPK